MRYLVLLVTTLGILEGSCLTSEAQSLADAFNAAYASAQTANRKAGELKNQWTTTSAVLAAAKKAAPAVASYPRFGSGAEGNEICNLKPFGNARLLHMTDTHAQLLPLYFREPS